MKIAEVKKVKAADEFPELSELSGLMDNMEKHSIDTINWKDYDYKPEVQFSIAYSDKEIYLKYYVREKYFKAEMTESNQNVYEDSCVEFFFSPENDGIYYNLEINGIGTCLLGSGTGRADTKRADPQIISKIRRLPYPWNKPVAETKGDISWSVTVAIPLEVYFRHQVKDLKGKTARANFYKCGDKLTVPHYVTWNPIGIANPDYHRPEYFGMLKFI
jgi:hypothetical protein